MWNIIMRAIVMMPAPRWCIIMPGAIVVVSVTYSIKMRPVIRMQQIVMRITMRYVRVRIIMD